MKKVIKDVVFYWAKIHEATKNFKGDGEEYSITCLINESDANELIKMKVNKKFSRVGDDASLMEKYGEENADRYVVKFTQNKFSSKGRELSVAAIYKNGTPIEKSVEIGNGSVGQVQIFLMEGIGLTKGKYNARLNSVMIQELVKYEKVVEDTEILNGFDIENDGDGFDIEVDSNTTVVSKTEQQSVIPPKVPSQAVMKDENIAQNVVNNEDPFSNATLENEEDFPF